MNQDEVIETPTELSTDDEARARQLAGIKAAAATLSALDGITPEPFVWTSEIRTTWWAFEAFGQQFGRYEVQVPQRFGWPVGDYPWAGVLLRGRDRYASEVFIKPTFVDAKGRVAPLNATRATPSDNPLLTTEMYAEILEALAELTRLSSPE